MREENVKKLLRERRKVETDLVAQGKKPFFLKKSIAIPLSLSDYLLA